VNLLWVTTSVPHPAGGGGRAHEYELIRALAPRHRIHVVTCDFRDTLGGDAVLATGAQFTQVPWKARAYPTSKFGVARGLVRADPTLSIWLARDRVPALARAVATITAEHPADAVQVTHGDLAALLDHLAAPTGLVLFDALTRTLATRRTVEPLWRRRLQLRVEIARARRFERRHYAKANAIASVSSVDAAAIETLTGRPVDVIENPIADEFFESPDRARTPNIVTFVGALAHQPNADAIRWLVRDIWPHVTAARPDTSLVVVGRADGDPTVPELRALVEGAGGRLEADVPDIRPYYWEAAVVVAPLRHGSGLRNKVIHAMACGAPVVATPSALEGIPPDAARHAWSGATAAEVAGAILAALGDPHAAATRAAAAKAGVAPLRTDAVAARHEQWWNRLREGRG
jgi:glycosyltransferase involved in cell wall biosynthesis